MKLRVLNAMNLPIGMSNEALVGMTKKKKKETKWSLSIP